MKVDIASLQDSAGTTSVPKPITLPLCTHCMKALVTHIYIEHDEAIVLWRGHYIPVSAGEHRVLKDMIIHAPRARTIRQMYAALRKVDGFHAADIANNVRTCIKRIRKKFLAVDPRFDCIVALTAVGYKWLGPDHA